MSIFTITHPAHVAVTAALQHAASMAQALRAMIALGAVGMLALVLGVCKPFLRWAFSVARLFLWLREPASQRRVRRRMEGVEMLMRMANDVAATQPNLAAELRGLAGRD